MTRILIIGAGGHGQVVADILQRMRDAGQPVVPLGYLDGDPAKVGRVLLGLPVLGAPGELSAFPHDAVIVAVGSNQTRRRIFQQLLDQGERFATAVHPRAVIAPDVRIGPGTVICANAVVNPGSVVGADVILNTGCTVDHHNQIGDHAHIAPGVHLGGDVKIGSGVLVGIGATVMPQRAVGDGVTISAGSLVHKDLPAGVTAGGVPARIIKQPSP